MTNNFLIQKLKEDQYRRAGEILYDTDPYIYPTAFGTEEIAGEVFPELFCLKSGAFSAENIYTAVDDNGQAAGVAVILASDEPDTNDYSKIKVRPELQDGFIDVCDKYISKLPDYVKEHPNSIYIPCICVAEESRGQGIGKALLFYLFEQFNEQDMILHVLEENSGAIKLYLSLGFQVVKDKVVGYGYKTEPPLCLEMRKPAVS